jgi:hypothetical protein
MRVTAVGTAYGEQFLWCESVADDVDRDAMPDPARVEVAVAAAHRFGAAAIEAVGRARDQLVELVSAGPVVLWGAGSKGMTYLNLVSDIAEVAAVVDVNPRKSGWGVPGTPFVVQPPTELTAIRPATVLAANPIYVGEIASSLDDLGVTATVRPLWS